MIRYTHGETFLKTVSINILSDLAFYILSFLIAFKIFRNYTEICGIFKHLSLLILLFLLLNSVVYTCTLKINSREIIYGHQYSFKMIGILNFIKSFSSVFTFIIISFIIILSPQISGFDKIYDILGDKVNYYLANVTFSVPNHIQDPGAIKEFMGKQTEKIDRMLYETDEIIEPIYIMDLSYKTDEQNFTPIYCNHRALPYIKKMIPDLKDIDIINNECAVILPQNLDEKTKSDAISSLLENFKRYESFEPDEDKVQILYYNEPCEILSFDNLHEFKYHISPCICITSDTMNSPKYVVEKSNHHYMLDYPLMKADNADELKKIFADYGFETACSTVSELYNEKYNFYKLILNLTKIITILMITLQISILIILIKLDYRINATELAIKKLSGYSLLQRYSTQFKNSLATLILNTIISAIIMLFIKSDIKVLLTAFIISIIEFLVLYTEIKSEEKKSIVKTLKGGAL